MKLSDPVYKSLVVFNTIAIFVFVLGGVVLAILGKNIIAEKASNLFHREMASSVLSSFSNDDDDPLEVDIPVYELQIKPPTMRRIQAQVAELTEAGMMTNDLKIWHPARFFHNGQEYKIKARLRGDHAWHWKNPKKSWRLKFPKDNFFDGRRYFDIIIPRDKYYEIEHVAYRVARELGLLVPDSGFCRVRINGVDLGVYLWIEKYGKEMLERQGYPEGEIFRQPNVWTQTRLTGFGLRPDYYTASFINTVHEDERLGYYAERWDSFVRLIREADDESFRRELPQMLDLDKYLKWNALTWVFGSLHSHWGDDLRWYYDNTSGLFEPILYDVLRDPIRVPPESKGDRPLWKFEGMERDSFARRVMEIPQYRQRRNEILWKLVTDDAFDVAALSDRYHRKIRQGLLSGADPELAWKLDKLHATSQKILSANRSELRDHLAFGRLFVAPEIGFHSGDTPALSLKLLPDSRARINIKRLKFRLSRSSRLDRGAVRVVLTDLSGRERVLDDTILARGDDDAVSVSFRDLAVWTPVDTSLNQVPGEWTLRLELPGIPSTEWRRPGEIGDVEVEVLNSISQEPLLPLHTMISPLAYRFDDPPASPMTRTVDEFVADSGLPFVAEGDTLTLPRGRYRIDRNLTLPFGTGLSLLAGTVLEMAPGVSVVSYSPVDIAGTAAEPVRIVAQSGTEPWGSFAVIRADAPSRVRHLEVSGGSEAHINGLYLSGQLAFYWSDVHLEHCSISGARADDGLNIKKANFSIRHSVLRDNMADAFDGDWVRGTIESSVFHDNGGDGIDLSGASVAIHDSVLQRMGDKAISAGEKSQVFAFNNVIRDSEIGVASKDLSNVELHASVLHGNRTAVTLYRKKQIFGGATAKSVGCLFWGNEQNVTTDELSSFDAVAIGADHWAEMEGSITVEGLLTGDPDRHYATNDDGSILHSRSDPSSSPFRITTSTEEATFGDLIVPNRIDSPAGLARPLVLDPANLEQARTGS